VFALLVALIRVNYEQYFVCVKLVRFWLKLYVWDWLFYGFPSLSAHHYCSINSKTLQHLLPFGGYKRDCIFAKESHFNHTCWLFCNHWWHRQLMVSIECHTIKKPLGFCGFDHWKSFPARLFHFYTFSSRLILLRFFRSVWLQQSLPRHVWLTG